MPSAKKIFISYSHKDSETAGKLVKDLKARFGDIFWIDSDDLESENFNEQIGKGIKNACVFILLLSEDSLNSNYCKNEIWTAAQYCSHIVPVLVSDGCFDIFCENFTLIQCNYDVTSICSDYKKGLDKLTEKLTKCLDDTSKNTPDCSEYIKMLHSSEPFLTLPESKLEGCIYGKSYGYENYSITDTIDLFNKLYIEKKVYKYQHDSNISDRINNFKSDVIGNDSILIGNAGCGKSTLLFRLYIDCMKSLSDGTEKIIPLFLDLNEITETDKSLEKAILRKARMKFNYIPRPEVFFAGLKALGYSVLLILDSLDECNDAGGNILISSQIAGLRSGNTFFLTKSGISYSIVIGARKGAYEEKSTDLPMNLLRYEVRDFDNTDTDIYLNKLIGNNIITTGQLESLKKNIELITYDEAINPFLLSMVVNSYSSNPSFMPQNYCIIHLLEVCVKSMLSRRNQKNSTAEDVSRETLEIIGICGILNDHDSDRFSKYCFTDFSYDDYRKNVKYLRNNTYLINSDGFFYQKTFADFYGAQYIFRTFGKCSKPAYYAIVDSLISDSSHGELFEYLALLADYDSKPLEDTSANALLTYMFEHASADTVYRYIKAMLKVIVKYSEKRILKDRLPINVDAVKRPSETITWLFSRYFDYMISHKLTVDFGYFYGIITSVGKYNEALCSILKLCAQNDSPENDAYFKMVSLIRDSYLNISFNKSEIVRFPYNADFEDEDIVTVVDIATHGKDFEELTLREALNAAFFCRKPIPVNAFNPDFDLSTAYFPTIYNLDLFTEGYDKGKSGGPVLVTSEDELLFSASASDFSVKLMRTSELNDNYISLDDSVCSLFIFKDDDSYEISDKIGSTGNILSVDISSGITSVGAYSLDKSFCLKNVILPDTLKRIGEFALYYSKQLASINIPDGVTEIGESAFEDCFSLSSIHIPASLETVDQYLFEECVSLKDCDFHGRRIELCDGMFKGCGSIADIDSLNLSTDIETFPLICFRQCGNIKTLDLTGFDRLSTVGNYCFAECEALEEVVFSSALKEIGMAVFYKCDNLKKIVFNSIPMCSAEMACGIGNPVEIVVCGKSRTISGREEFMAFMEECGAVIRGDRIIDGVCFERKNDGSFILNYTFNHEEKDFEVFNTNRPEYDGITISEITIGAFGDCEYLNDVIFKDLDDTADWMFEDCDSLYNVKLGKTHIKRIAAHMFENCTALKEIVIPATVERIENCAFESCGKLTTIHFNKNCTDNCPYIDDECDADKRKTRSCNMYRENILNIPCNIKYVGKYAFHNCRQLTKIIINSEETVCDPLAFEGCGCKPTFPVKAKKNKFI